MSNKIEKNVRKILKKINNNSYKLETYEIEITKERNAFLNDTQSFFNGNSSIKVKYKFSPGETIDKEWIFEKGEDFLTCQIIDSGYIFEGYVNQSKMFIFKDNEGKEWHRSMIHIFDPLSKLDKLLEDIWETQIFLNKSSSNSIQSQIKKYSSKEAVQNQINNTILRLEELKETALKHLQGTDLFVMQGEKKDSFVNLRWKLIKDIDDEYQLKFIEIFDRFSPVDKIPQWQDGIITKDKRFYITLNGYNYEMYAKNIFAILEDNDRHTSNILHEQRILQKVIDENFSKERN